MGMQSGGDAERVRRDLGETCHNDKPGRNDGDGGGGSRWKGETCYSSKPGLAHEDMEAR